MPISLRGDGTSIFSAPINTAKDVIVGRASTVTGISTANTLQVNANATVDGTATLNYADMSNARVGGAMTVVGPLSVQGVLTYEDVTSVDSVGVLTARSEAHLGYNKLSGISTYVGIGTDVPTVDLDASNATGAIALPQGTTAQRPSGSDPYIRYNTTNSALEFYDGTSWVEIITDYFPTGSTILG